MALRLITAPTVEPVTLVEAKAHLRVDHSDDDTLIGLLIESARHYIDGPEGFLGRAIITQTWELVLDEFPTNEIRIPLPPLQSVTSVIYDDADGNEQTVDAADYAVDTASEPGWVVPSTAGWPTVFEGINAVRIRFVAGYAPSIDSPPDLRANVPGSIKAALLLLIGALYEHREQTIVGQATTELPWGAEHLLRRHRMHLGMA